VVEPGTRCPSDDTGWTELDENVPTRLQQLGDSDQQRGRVSADADGPVEQQGGCPRPRPWGRAIDRTLHNLDPARPGQNDRGRGEVEAQSDNAPPRQGQQMTAWTAADVEHGSHRPFEDGVVLSGSRAEPPAPVAGQTVRPLVTQAKPTRDVGPTMEPGTEVEVGVEGLG